MTSAWSAPMVHGAALGALGWCLVALSRRPLLAMISKAGAVRPNYAGHDIPVSAGILLSLAAALLVAVAQAAGWAAAQSVSIFAELVLGFGLLGLIDDLMGSREESGLRGHLTALARGGRLTTGGLKAICGAALAAFVALTLAPSHLGVLAWVAAWAARAGVLALSANLVNLLDLRPGRAVKGYSAVVAASALALLIGRSALPATSAGLWVLEAGLLGAALAYAPADLQARAMMGDAGSNALGASAGLTVCATAPALGHGAEWWLWAWFLALAVVHLYAEKHSITRAIEQNRLLRALDGLGRGGV